MMRLPESIIENAVRQKEIEMYLQFIVSAEEEKIIAAEALARWNHPEKGIIQPAAFAGDSMPEQDGLALDLHMFEHVCRKLDSWRKKGWGSCRYPATSREVIFPVPHLQKKCSR